MGVKNENGCRRYMKWGVCVMGFEEIDALKRLVPNLIRSGVNDILYFDGAFEYFPTKYYDSRDGSIEFLRKFDQVKIIECGLMPHVRKSTYRFEKAGQMGYDAIVFLDCDEIIVGDFQKFINVAQTIRTKMNMDVFNIPLFDLDLVYRDRSLAMRLFFNPQHYYYSDLHWTVFDKRTHDRVLASHTVGGIQVFHDSGVRPKKREDRMKKFQEIYTPIETAEYRKKHSIKK